MNRSSSLLQLMASMCIFGTIGLFRRWIPYPSALIAFSRGLIGAAAIFLLLTVRRSLPDWRAAGRKLLPLLASGVCLGGNWVLLFEAYRFTAVSVATVCYYMAPVFAMLAAALLFRERLTAKKLVCIALACLGMVLVSGILSDGLSGARGILFGIGAAVLYAAVMILNRLLGDIRSYDRTVIQLAVSAVAVGLYSLCTDDLSQLTFTPIAVLMLLTVGIVHTGVAYALYFGSMQSLPTQTVALFSYIDPAVSILLSALILREPLTPLSACGIALVLGSAILNELRLPGEA